MVYSRFTLAAAAAAVLGAASAQLTIIAPGGPDLWWIAQSENNIVWTCETSPYGNFTVLIANQDPKVLTAPIAIAAIENNYDCSLTITQLQANQPPGTGYLVQLSSIYNETDVYAQSQPFEIKAVGSTYPASSATPSASGTQTSSGAASASPTAGGGSSGKPSGAVGGMGVSAAAALAMAGLGLAALIV